MRKKLLLIAQGVSLRKERRISQNDIQMNCGMTQQAISRLEKAENSTSLNNFIKYFDATGFELVV